MIKTIILAGMLIAFWVAILILNTFFETIGTVGSVVVIYAIMFYLFLKNKK